LSGDTLDRVTIIRKIRIISAKEVLYGEPMPLNTEALKKILALESEKGFTDSAVIGGLDKFLHNWSGQAAEAISDKKLLGKFRKLTGTKYSSLTKEQRKEWVDNLLSLTVGAGLKPARSGDEKKPPEKALPLKKPVPKHKTTLTATGISLDSPVTVVKGISTSLAPKFEKLGVKTVRDMLYFFPNRHIDYSRTSRISQLTEGKEETIIANVWQSHEVRPGGRRSSEAILGDETGNIRAVWFNNPFVAKQLQTNSRVIISGKVGLFQGQHVFQSPEWELVGENETVHTGRLVPLYPLTAGLHPRQVRRLMKEAVDRFAGQLPDFLPADIRERCRLLGLTEAISQAHYPNTEESKDKARIRLAFDELFILQLGVLSKKSDWQESQPANPIKTDNSLLEKFLKSLPFKLTDSQDKSLREMLKDLARPVAMSRLLQGDVGSGKTVVATAALLMAAADGFQGALMAPTEILAEQHFITICNLFANTGHLEEEDDCVSTYSGILPRPLSVAILIGGLTKKRKQQVQQLIRDGMIDIAIGTHALIQEEVAFKKLGFAVIDEQHRFGVEQRSALRQKGFNPHIAVMTATPIPRTLALTLYGDLDLSVINELPPGRLPVKTKWLKPSQRDSAYAFIRKQIAAGRQAFIICPLIEESEAVQARAAAAEYERLSHEVFPDLRLGLLHGRISATEKDKVMRTFYAGQLDILVATPVVEVGIDVPNATVMLVESADRFGLSQLHQFRGRVGRGAEQSYCMLLAENPSEVARQRLDIIETTQDGFKLAEEDLKLRGPGEFFGTRQSGLPDLKMAKLSDVHILELARAEAIRLFEKDKKLTGADHKPLARELARVWSNESGEWS
jgi:ATP-dependent DNA helicase RecG